MLLKILVIDDDLECVDRIKKILETKSITTTSIQEFDEDFLMESFEPPDIIILEMMMFSFERGRQFIEKYNEIIQSYRIPIIALSEIKRDKFLSSEFYVNIDWTLVKSTLNKPVKPVALLESVKYILQEHGTVLNIADDESMLLDNS